VILKKGEFWLLVTVVGVDAMLRDQVFEVIWNLEPVAAGSPADLCQIHLEGFIAQVRQLQQFLEGLAACRLTLLLNELHHSAADLQAVGEFRQAGVAVAYFQLLIDPDNALPVAVEADAAPRKGNCSQAVPQFPCSREHL
jgi:hypothetical protein